jgi:hypothetical protein
VPGEKTLAIHLDLLQKEIAKHYRAHSLLAVRGKRLAHLCLVLVVVGAFRDQNLVKRDPETGRLSLEQDAPYAVHADPVVVPRYRRQQGRNPSIGRPLNLAEGHAAVFAAAPGDQYGFLLQSSFHPRWSAANRLQ